MDIVTAQGKRRWEATSTRGIISENHDAKWGAEAETQPEPEPEPSCLFCCQGVSQSSVSWFRFSLCPCSKARDKIIPVTQLLTHTHNPNGRITTRPSGRKRDRNVNLSLDRSPGSAAASCLAVESGVGFSCWRQGSWIMAFNTWTH